MKRIHIGVVASAAVAALLFGPSPALAQTAPPLGTVQPFAVLGGSAVTAAGGAGTVISGNVGSAPTSTVNGFPPAVVTAGFTVYTAASAVTTSARTDATTAYNNLKAQVCPAANVIAGGTLGGKNLSPGVYCMPTGDLTGTLTLTGVSTDIWVFQMTLDTLTTAGASRVVMAGGASACNVYWQVSSSATLGAASTFSGSIFSAASIGVGTTAAVTGRTIAGSGAVTMDGSDTVGGCSAAPVCPVITLSPATLPNGQVGTAYSQTIVASGGTAPYGYSLTAGALPAGLTLTPAGVLAGTPTTAATSNFTIRGTDVNGCFAERAYTVIIAAAPIPPPVCPVITLTPATLPNGQVGVAYTQTIVGSGGTAPYSFGVIAGTLPAGLTLTSAGVLAGTPTTAATSTVTIRGTDAVGCFAQVVYTMIIAAAPIPPPVCPVITLTPATLPNGQVGVAYTQTIVGSGGTAPYLFGVTAGALPTGLTLTSAGVLAGTPTTAGTSAFTIRGTDANGCFAELPYSIVVATPVPTLPQTFAMVLALGLAGAGYLRLRRRTRSA